MKKSQYKAVMSLLYIVFLSVLFWPLAVYKLPATIRNYAPTEKYYSKTFISALMVTSVVMMAIFMTGVWLWLYLKATH